MNNVDGHLVLLRTREYKNRFRSGTEAVEIVTDKSVQEEQKEKLSIGFISLHELSEILRDEYTCIGYLAHKHQKRMGYISL